MMFGDVVYLVVDDYLTSGYMYLHTPASIRYACIGSSMMDAYLNKLHSPHEVEKKDQKCVRVTLAS